MFIFELSTLVTHLYIWSAVVIVGVFFWAIGMMSLTIAFACVFGLLTNVIHRWAHTRAQDNTAPIKALQHLGLFQSTDHHTLHHIEESDTHYCLLTDHVNPLLEAIGLWKRLEAMLLHIGIRKFWWKPVKATS